MTDTQATLELLRADLDKRPAPAESVPPAGGMDVNWTGVAQVLRELRAEFTKVADDSEKLLSQHPFAVIAAALVVGFVAGRILGVHK